MNNKRPTSFLFACLLIAVLGLGAAKKEKPLTIRFHGEGAATDHEKMVTKIMIPTANREAHMQVIPLVSERDIVSFMPFPSPAGDGTYGAYFKLDTHGTNLLEQHSLTKTGTFLIVLVNGRQVVELLIDQGIRDGILPVSRGFQAAEIELMRAKYPIIGEEGKKREKPKKAPKEKATPPPARNALP